MVAELVLDPQLRYWVLLPISVAMVAVGVLRIYVTQLINQISTGSKTLDLKKSRERTNSFVLPTQESFQQRQQAIYEALHSLKYVAKKPEPNQPDLPQDPAQMTDMLFAIFKSNLMNYIPQTLIMWWVNYFFAGFVIMKLPFPLTLQFKSMLQSGIVTQDLDVRWVSSISWYFVNLLGLRAIYALIFDDIEPDLLNAQLNAPSMPNASNPMQQMHKVMKQEAENVQLSNFKSCLDGVESRILQLYGK